MIRLIQLFILEYLKIWFYVLIAGVALLLLGPKLGVDREVLFLPPFLFLGGVFLGASFLQRNSSWIKSLPLSKTKFFLAAFFSSFINLLLLSLVWAVYGAGLYLLFIKRDDRSFIEFVNFKDWAPFFRTSEGMMSGCLALGAFFFSTFNPFVNRIQQVQKIQNIPFKRKVFFALLLIACFVILTQINSYFIIMSLVLCAEWWFFYQALNRELAIYKDVRKWIRSGISFAVLVQVILVYATAYRELDSADAAKMIRAERFLGVAALPLPEDRLVRVFSEVHDPALLSEIIDLNPRMLSLLNVEVWIKTKPEPKLLMAIEKKLVPEDLSKEKILELLNRYDELKLDPRPALYTKLLQSRITGEDLKDFVGAPGRHSFLFGVLLCRKFMDQSCGVPLLERLKVLGDGDLFSKYVMEEILRTLSILRAKHLGFEFYSELKADKVSTKDWTVTEPQVNCEEGVNKNLGEASGTDIAQLNFCIRNAAMKTPKGSFWNRSVAFWSKEEIQKFLPQIQKLLIHTP